VCVPLPLRNDYVQVSVQTVSVCARKRERGCVYRESVRVRERVCVCVRAPPPAG